MKKGRNGGETGKTGGGGRKRKRLMIIVGTTSLPTVDRPNIDRWSATCSCQYKQDSGKELHKEPPWWSFVNIDQGDQYRAVFLWFGYFTSKTT